MTGEPSFARFRHLRSSEHKRRENAETILNVSDFIYPMFVTAGSGIRREIGSMPGQFQLSVDLAVELARRAIGAGVDKILLFGLPQHKDSTGTSASDPAEAVQRTTSGIKDAVPEMTVITDVCLCEYTDHGHCGVITPAGDVDNDATLPLLAEAAVSHANAGADIVAPSAMMDGQVASIRRALDNSGMTGTKIMGYSAKYASSFYGPFRDAAGSTPQFGDRRSYQMAPTQADEAMQEIRADIDEGADFIMVKPALAYLDIIRRAKQEYPQPPLAAYNVSGEYASIVAASANGWLDREQAAIEVLTAIKRAGADMVITYFALDAAGWLARNT